MIGKPAEQTREGYGGGIGGVWRWDREGYGGGIGGVWRRDREGYGGGIGRGMEEG